MKSTVGAGCFAILSLVGGGCGGDTSDVSGASGGEAGSGGTATQSHFYLGAQKGQATYAIEVDAATGRVTPFGPAIPASTLLSNVAPLAGGLVMANAGNADGDPSYVWVGDGTSWTQVDGGSCEVAAQVTHAGMYIVVFEYGCTPADGGATSGMQRILDPSGEMLWSGALNDSDGIVDVASDDSYFVYAKDGRVHLQTLPAGTDTLLDARFTSGALTPHALFSTSLLLPDSDGNEAWLDLQGTPISVAGASAMSGEVGHLAEDATFQIVSGRLSLLGDRTVTAAMAVPVGTTPGNVLAVSPQGNLALVRPNGAGPILFIDSTGATRSTFSLSDAPSNVFVGAGFADTSWFVVEQQFITTNPDGTSTFSGGTGTRITTAADGSNLVQSPFPRNVLGALSGSPDVLLEDYGPTSGPLYLSNLLTGTQSTVDPSWSYAPDFPPASY